MTWAPGTQMLRIPAEFWEVREVCRFNGLHPLNGNGLFITHRIHGAGIYANMTGVY